MYETFQPENKIKQESEKVEKFRMEFRRSVNVALQLFQPSEYSFCYVIIIQEIILL